MSVLPINYNTYRSVTAFNKRVRFLILHYTAENFNKSVSDLAYGNLVSVHYLVPDPTEQTYIDAGYNSTQIFNLVDENDRAWHAGVSYWAGRTNLNDASIGIENVNIATDDGTNMYFPDWNHDQIDILKKLVANIVSRYPDITPTNILAHSDIAVGRKSDPGPKFPWKEFFDEGLGAWYDDSTKAKYESQFNGTFPSRTDIVNKFQTYGYNVTGAATGDDSYKALVRAFQLHFRASDYSGVIDTETAAILYALVDKYFS